MLYANDGSWNVTVVDGLTLTGVQAADGSINVIASAGSSPVGLYHACGAFNVTLVTNENVARMADDGSLNVVVSPYASTRAQRITVVSGAF